MRILLALDGSPCGDVAIEEVADRPWPDETLLGVLTVFELPLPPKAENRAFPVAHFEQLEDALRKQAPTITDGTLQKLQANKTLSLSSLLVFGSARSVILDEAESWRADPNVVGSHGYSGLSRFWSCAKRVQKRYRKASYS